MKRFAFIDIYIYLKLNLDNAIINMTILQSYITSFSSSPFRVQSSELVISAAIPLKAFEGCIALRFLLDTFMLNYGSFNPDWFKKTLVWYTNIRRAPWIRVYVLLAQLSVSLSGQLNAFRLFSILDCILFPFLFPNELYLKGCFNDLESSKQLSILLPADDLICK